MIRPGYWQEGNPPESYVRDQYCLLQRSKDYESHKLRSLNVLTVTRAGRTYPEADIVGIRRRRTIENLHAFPLLNGQLPIVDGFIVVSQNGPVTLQIERKFVWRAIHVTNQQRKESNYGNEYGSY